jgi:hypothetical protein
LAGAAAKMTRTLEQLNLLGELEKIRRTIKPRIPQALTAGQGLRLHEVNTPRQAIFELMVGNVRLLKKLPPEDIGPEHPGIGALSTLLQHPEATREALDLLPAKLAARVEAALARCPGEWAPRHFEGALVQYVKTVGAATPLEPRSSLAMQQFASEPLQTAWNLLFDLTVLVGRGLL